MTLAEAPPGDHLQPPNPGEVNRPSHFVDGQVFLRPVRRHRPRLAASPGSAPRLTDPASVRVRVRHRTRVMRADAADGLPKGPSPKANAAVDYLNALYRPDDRLAIVAVGRNGPNPKVEQRVGTARAARVPASSGFSVISMRRGTASSCP